MDRLRDKAIALREAGGSIREIANELGVPRATTGDWLRGIGALPLAVESTSVDRRLTLRKSYCSNCGMTKSWAEFWAAAKWADGTMRRPQSHCWECVKTRRRQRRRQDSEWAREQNRKDWQRIKVDPEKLARRRELTRENLVVYRLRRKEAA